MENFGKLNLRVMLVLAVLAFFILAGCTSSAGNQAPNPAAAQPTPAGPAQQIPSGQAIKLSSTPGGEYVPSEIRVKQGSKVRIEGDTATLVGGMDTIVIDGYNLQKIVSSGDNVLEFVADKPGTYEMHCANGMGYGQLIVE